MADRTLPLPPGLRPQEGLAEEAARVSVRRQQAYANILDSDDASTARQARLIGRDLGIPSSAVTADINGFREERNNRDALSALGDIHVSNFVANPGNAAAVKDDLPTLSEMSAIYRLTDESRDPNLIQNYMKRTAPNGGLISALTLLPAARRASLGPVDVSKQLNTKMPAPARERINTFQGLDATVTGFISGGARGVETFLADAIGLGEEYRATDYYKQTGNTVRNLNREAAEPLRNIEENTWAPNSVKWFGARSYEAAQSLSILGASLVSGNPLAALSIGAGGEQYNRVSTRGGTANEALASGAIVGGSEAFFERFGLNYLLGNFGKKAASKFIGGLLLREVPSEMATTAVQGLADALVTGGQGWESYKKNLPEDLLNTAASTALMVGALGGGNYVARRLRPEQRGLEEIGRAVAGGDFIDRLMAAAEKSKVRQEDPETIREFVEARTEATPVRSIYVPVEAVAEYMQSEGYDGSLDRYQDQISEAQATQGDVVIPVADAVAYLAGTPTWEALREQVRVEPGGLSRKEATEKHAEIIAVLEQRGKEIAAEAQSDDAAASDAAEVYREVKNRLRIAGIDDKQADATAQIYAARYEARAGRMGGTATEQFKRSKISFPGETPGQYAESREVAQDAVLNIGLDIPGGGRLEQSEALQALQALGVEVTETEVRQSASEPTLIAQINRALTPEEAHGLSEALRQEAVVQYSGGQGGIYGPLKENWGEFNPDFFLMPSGRTLQQAVVALPDDEQAASAVGAYKVARSRKFKNIREFKDEVQRAVKSAKVNLRHPERLFRLAVADAEQALMYNRNAVGWYNEKVAQALAVLGQLQPEINTDPDARFAFIYALAVTSNGLRVDRNFQLALKVYRQYRESGVMPSIGEGTAQEAIAGSLNLFNKLVERFGSIGAVRDFMLTPHTVKELKALGFPITGENAATSVLGAAILGPKIGNGFFGNLYGQFDQLTMDRWFLRTWGRWTGTLIEVDATAVKRKRDELQAVLRSMDANERAAIGKILSSPRTQFKVKISDVEGFAARMSNAASKKSVRDQLAALPNGDLARRVSQRLTALSDGQKEAPKNGAERNEIRAVMTDVLKELQRSEPALTMADLQALLWYPEKTLYDTAVGSEETTGYADDDAPDYANAAVSLAKAEGLSERKINAAISEANAAIAANGAGRAKRGPRELHQDVLPEAGWTPERVSGLIDQYGREDGSSSVIAVMMSPAEFLGLTASPEGIAAMQATVEQDYGQLDIGQLDRSPPIMLTVARGGENDTRPPPMIRGHDGRHRMVMLQQAGFARVPVLVELTDKDGKTFTTKEPIRVSNILGNRSRSNPLETSRVADGVVEGVPVSWRFKEQLQELHGRVLAQSDTDVFYSAAERVVAEAKMNKASAEQWKALLSPGKTPGIKAEEIEWTGIHDWLDMQKGAIDKDALLQVLRDQGIQVAEVVQGGLRSTGDGTFQSTMQQLRSEYVSQEFSGREPTELDIFGSDGRYAWAAHEGNVGPFEVRVAGLDENMEPRKPLATFDTVEEAEQFAHDEGARRTEEFRNEALARFDAMSLEEKLALADRLHFDGDLYNQTEYSSYTTDPNNRSYRELLITMPVGKAGNPDRAPDTHWNTEGVVAHIRFMEKKDADGKRVLFIEEIQSDWHQKGRDQGYQGEVTEEEKAAAKEEVEKAERAVVRASYAVLAKAPEVLEKWREVAQPEGATFNEYGRRQNEQFDNLMKRIGEFNMQTDAGFVLDDVARDIADDAARFVKSAAFNPLMQEELTALNTAKLRVTEAYQRQNDAEQGSGIPEAPFKSSWPTLAMKRAIRWAVDNGFERVAWIKGSEQNGGQTGQRIGTIEATKEGELYRIQLPNSPGLFDHLRDTYSEDAERGALLTADRVKQVFGAALGERIMAATEDSWVTIDAHDEVYNQGGWFYDRNLVNITNDIIKKYGAKVGKVRIFQNDTYRQIHDDLPGTIAQYEENLALARRIDGPEQIADWEAALERKHQELEKAQKDAERNGFEITDKMRDAARTGFTLFQNAEGPRGTTTITNDGQHIIQLFGTANRSTLLHETGHIWLEELKADAAENEDAKRDFDIVRKWWKANGVDIEGGEIPTEGHELFARGIERYFMEGKAPTQQLQGVFKTFRAWLLRIYQVVQNLRTPITPEIREVFDRLLATQAALEDAAAQNPSPALFKTAEEAGMTEAEFADYQQRITDARDEAYDTLLFKTMEQIRKAKNADRRQQRAAVRAEVGAEISRQPQFRLLHLLRTGKWLGDPDREAVDVKLNTGWLIDNYGEDIFDKLPRGIQIWAGRGETGDVVAEMVGLASGADVVQTLLGMRAASDALRAKGETRSMRDVMIEEEVERAMTERYGDPLNDGSIEEEAIAALNTARQGEIIGAEIRQLGKRKSAIGVPTPYQFAREWARRTVAAGDVRDVASRSALQRYTRAAAKSARLAEEAILEGDVDEAYRQKQAQLLNHALLAEAKAAADRVDKIVNRMRKLAGRAAQASIDPDYLGKIHMLLERYDFRPKTQKSIDEQEGFQQWLEQQRAKGFEVHIPPRLQNAGVNYTRVSVEELEALNDMVESLVHLGRVKQKLKLAGQERDFAEFRDEVVARIKQLPDRKASKERWWKSGKLTKNSPINEDERLLAASAAELLKVETIIEELDGGPTGPLHDAIVVGATNAENMRYALRERVLKPIAAAYHKMSRKQRKRLEERVTIPELTWNTLNEGDPRLGDPVTMTRMELLSVFLNMGNLSNLEKLSKGERWPVETLKAVVNRELTKEDMDFAQTLWDQVDTLWPDIVRVEGALAGVVPEKVIEAPIITPHGEYKGGYWPVVYDAARWQRAEDIEGKRLDDMFGIKSGVATQKGHTITRTAAFGPINLNLENVLFQHIEQVVTRIAFAEYARDVLRIIKDRPIRGWIDTKLGPEYRKQIEKWLARQVHEGAVHAKAARWWDRTLKQARINVTIAAMGLRISTGVAQTLGLTASAQRIGAKWVGVGFKRLLTPGATEFAYSRSPEILHRTEAVNREVAELSAKMRGKHSWWTNAQSWAMWHIGMIDRYMVALPTWLGAHARGISEGMTDEEASAFADKSVRLSQGAGREKDLSAIQSPNSEAMKFFTMFYTPFNVMFNMQWQGVRGLKRGDPRPMIGVTFWWLMASTLGDAFLSGDWPDAEEDENPWIEWFGRNVFFGLFAGIPLARDFANYTERKMIGEYASDAGTTPITRIAQVTEKAWKVGSKAYDGEEITNPIKQGGDISAVLLGMPTSQVGTTAQFAWDVHNEDVDPETLSDWYFGITRGKTRSDEKGEQ